MANDNLNAPVVISAVGLSAASLPSGLSRAYETYILSQSTDVTNIAGKANEAGQGAYDAQVKNDEQDVELADHEQRLDAAEAELANHEARITAAEATLVNHEGRITANEAELANHEIRITQNEADIANQGARLTTAEGKITALQSDYVSKSAVTSQTLASPLNVTASYSIGGTQVIGPRQSGWTAGTGTPNLGAFNANQTFTVSNPPTQAEVQAIVTALIAERQRTLALEQMARTHGLIN